MDVSVSLLNLILWVLFGFVVGFIVHVLDPADVKGGVVGTTLLGILGAIVGGFVSNILFGIAIIGFNPQGFATAIGGGLILAFLSRIIFRNRGHIRTMVKKLS